MQDFLGKELAEGDWVVLNPHGYKNFVRGQIVAFTAKMVRVEYVFDWRPHIKETILREPSNLVRI